MTEMEIREYYEKEAEMLANHQEKMYFGDPWCRYWHGTRFMKLLEIMKSLKFKSILEVGCAEGYYLKFLVNGSDSSELCRVGLDISKGYLIKAKVNTAGAALVQGDASNLPFKDNCFDVVFCSEVLEHVPNPEKVFAELTRTSKKNVLLTVAGENLFYYIVSKLRLIKQETEPYSKMGHGHIHEMRIKEVTSSWAPERNLKTIKCFIDCHFPVAFFQRHKMPVFLIPLIRFADKIVNLLPVVKEFGSSQIALLEKMRTELQLFSD